MRRMVSGLFLSGAKSGYNAIQFTRMGQEAFDTGSYRDYISLGLLSDHDSEAYRYAEEIRAKLRAGREVTNIEMGQLTAAVYADALGVGEKRSEEAREEPDEEIWDGVFDEENAAHQRTLEEELWQGTKSAVSEDILTDELLKSTIRLQGPSGALDPNSKAAEKHAEQYYVDGKDMEAEVH